MKQETRNKKYKQVFNKIKQNFIDNRRPMFKMDIYLKKFTIKKFTKKSIYNVYKSNLLFSFFSLLICFSVKQETRNKKQKQ